MRLVFIAALAALTLDAASGAEESLKIDRAAFEKVSLGVDNTLKTLWPDYPAEMVGVTHAVYIRGYGAVITGEVNVAPSSGITPFHQSTTPSDIKNAHEKKLQRMPALKAAMQGLLIDSAAQLRDVPDNEEVALAVSLFYWRWEDRSGLPDQLVIHATKKAIASAAKDRTLAAVRIEVY